VWGTRDPLRQTLLAFHHDQASAQRLLTVWICQQEADLLRINVSQVDAQRSFSEVGLGSLLSVELRNNLEAALELTFPISILWSYSTPEDLSSHLTSLLFTQAKRLFADTSSSYQKEETKKARTEPIAVIGMSCRFPGGANSPEAFWQMLAEGHDAIREIPPDRYDINEFYSPDIDAPGKTVSRWGGFLDQIDQFDPTFFNISPREATYLDPQQRLLLEVTWEAMERAGLLPEKLAGSQTGVFIGLFNRDYFDLLQEQLFIDRAASANAYMGTGNGPSTLRLK
jgi:acyl carrier protein